MDEDQKNIQTHINNNVMIIETKYINTSGTVVLLFQHDVREYPVY